MKKRINITIPEQYHAELNARDINLSGLITGLLGDHLAGNTITLEVSDATKQLYDQVIANTGYSDADIEVLLHVVLEYLLESKIAQLESLRNRVEKTLEQENLGELKTQVRAVAKQRGQGRRNPRVK